MGRAKATDDPFAEREETRAQARQRVKEEKKAPVRSKREDDDDKGKGGIKFGPLLFLILIVSSSLLPALVDLFDKLGKMGFTAFQVDHEAKLRRFYENHNPEKVKDVPSVLRKYKGREEVLYQKLSAKYGVSP
mmetsp:Transcript_15288/g.41060  ORF Transcript_15288/g.41060 Transcript_15288/m.41060 type:complete len:133 (-) Transcript_15288:599-997(-)